MLIFRESTEEEIAILGDDVKDNTICGILLRFETSVYYG